MIHKLTAIEFTSSGLRLLSGYELNGKLYVEASIETGPLCLGADGYVEKDSAVKVLSEALLQLKQKISGIGGLILLVPPVGFGVKNESYSTATSSPDAVISFQDYHNCTSMMEKDVYIPLKTVVYEAPVTFGTDNQKGLDAFPLRVSSRRFDLNADVHFVEEDMLKHYQNILREAGVKPYLTIVSSYAGISLMNTYPDAPDNYLSLVIEGKYTYFSEVSSHRLVSSEVIPFGSRNLINAASKVLGLSEERTAELLQTYGFMKESRFVYRTDEDLSLTDLYTAFDKGLDNLVLRLGSILKEKNPSLPIIFYGPKVNLRGLPGLLSERLFHSVIVFQSQVIGARSQSLNHLLGAVHLGSLPYQMPQYNDSAENDEAQYQGFHR